MKGAAGPCPAPARRGAAWRGAVDGAPRPAARDLGMLPGPASPWRAGDPRRRVPHVQGDRGAAERCGVLLGGPPAGRRDPVPWGCVRQPSKRDGRPRHDSPGPIHRPLRAQRLRRGGRGAAEVAQFWCGALINQGCRFVAGCRVRIPDHPEALSVALLALHQRVAVQYRSLRQCY